MTNEQLILVGTICVGVLTAFIHIFVTYRVGKTTVRISNDNLEQQKKTFSKTKAFDYLNDKRKFLETAMREINVNEGAVIKENDNYFAKVAEIITNQMFRLDKTLRDTEHYLDRKSTKKYFKFSQEFWNAKTVAQISAQENYEDANQRIEDFENKIEAASEYIEYGKKIIKNELSSTVSKIEKIIKVS